MLWMCPICHSPLQHQSQHKNFRCSNNHCFDIAKEGYCNLVPANQKNSKNPGDSKAMIQARRLFLGAGHYQHLADALSAMIIRHHPTANNILEVGCGEGYYLRQIDAASQPNQDTRQYHGLDISKEAVKLAARANKSHSYSVASSFNMPVLADGGDIIIRNFAPAPSEQIQRALSDDGLFIVVTPGQHHLFQLRELIYRSAKPHESDITGVEGFNLIDQQHLSKTIHINVASEVSALLQMTPYYWQTSAEDQLKLDQLKQLECQTDFVISVFKQ
ncbi:23S rRNA (guanine(745)-N(1))-methyltransferase [Sinobacterium norvegicum]|uniref:23S rRNA (Guanine(745)-N(1))-methyltransferase n=1 Tax=Sinobacterium norvegicum TaxID=1641715 RepID=A0ABN8EM54_9GAMM|nr:methyltransferase domain-containing protein [Sinobacterium norvegicum]CAH0992815.1 23S rRNA (guanine(745)-N(1))-methyltransferase [Sinobacterium norvegicum]